MLAQAAAAQTVEPFVDDAGRDAAADERRPARPRR